MLTGMVIPPKNSYPPFFVLVSLPVARIGNASGSVTAFFRAVFPAIVLRLLFKLTAAKFTRLDYWRPSAVSAFQGTFPGTVASLSTSRFFELPSTLWAGWKLAFLAVGLIGVFKREQLSAVRTFFLGSEYLIFKHTQLYHNMRFLQRYQDAFGITAELIDTI